MRQSTAIIISLAVTFALGIFMYVCMTGAEGNTIWLGDEVTTSDRYTTLFNDSFSGRVVTKDDGMYTVRDENGTERELDRHWLDKVDAEEVI